MVRAPVSTLFWSHGAKRWPTRSLEERSETWRGAFGFAPHASFCRGDLVGTDDRRGKLLALGGLLENAGYLLELSCSPPPSAQDEALLMDFLRHGIRYLGRARNPRWDDAEIAERWDHSLPAGVRPRMRPPLRTRHFIILGNSSAGPAFGRKVEEYYERVRAFLPFEDLADRRLLPILLFRRPREYHDFASCFGVNGSRGFASLDFHASWYVSPAESVHLHEITHQLMRNRLRLGGGGSWFQEGLAQYLATRAYQRRQAARRLVRGEGATIAELLRTPRLSQASRPLELYNQAALLIEFLRESRWGRGRFGALVRAVGRTPIDDWRESKRAMETTLGCDLDTVQARWVAYCKSR